MGFSGFASLLAYLFLFAALFLYGEYLPSSFESFPVHLPQRYLTCAATIGIPIWGCPKVINGSIVELSTNTTGFVELELGYFGT